MSKTYTFEVTQWIEVKADSYEEAVESLPLYPTGFEGQKYYVTDETVVLQYDKAWGVA